MFCAFATRSLNAPPTRSYPCAPCSHSQYEPCGHALTCADCTLKLEPLERGCQNCHQAVTGLIQAAEDTFDPKNNACTRKLGGCTHRRDTMIKPCMCFDSCFSCSNQLKGCPKHRQRITERLRVFYQ